jgi:ABC-type nitrate/sulfonate/bicarbonate transport system substrate-binding protein
MSIKDCFLSARSALHCSSLRFRLSSPWAESPESKRMITVIEYGVPTDRCGLQLRLGAEKGFFRDEDIDLNVRIVFGGPEIAAEFDSGRLPVGELGTPPGLTALAKGALALRSSEVAFAAGRFNTLLPILGFPDWSDLSGANLGVLSRGSCSDWYMREVLKHHANRSGKCRDDPRSRKAVSRGAKNVCGRRTRRRDHFRAPCYAG